MTISLVYEGVTVDLTDNNTSVQLVVNNPFYIIPTPAESGATPNEFIIDISMLSTQFMLSFDLKDGIGTGNWTSTASTKLEKIMYFISDGVNTQRDITFTWGGMTTTVKMAGFRGGTEPGKKDLLLGCSMTLQRSKPLT